jgi:hypothetical protein
MKYIHSLLDLEGKTIAKLLPFPPDSLIIAFTDGSWTQIESQYEPYETSLDCPDIADLDDYVGNQLYQLGLISYEEFTTMTDDYYQSEKDKTKIRRRKIYEELKLEFADEESDN